LPSDVIAKQMMELRFSAEIDGTAQIRPPTTGFPGTRRSAGQGGIGDYAGLIPCGVLRVLLIERFSDTRPGRARRPVATIHREVTAVAIGTGEKEDTGPCGTAAGMAWWRFAPAKSRPGAHARVQLTGTKGRTGSQSGIPLRKKNQAIGLIRWPGGSAARTVKGNLTIRYVMERCAAF
jgi:hypothetical protein